MNQAAKEWQAIREAYRKKDAFALLAMVTADGRRRRFSRLLVKYDFSAPLACVELEVDRQISVDETVSIFKYLQVIQ